MTVQPFAETLIEELTRDLNVFRSYGAEEHASMLRSVLDKVRDVAEAYDNEMLTLEDAAEESGYSYSSIHSKVRSGKIPNAGVKGSPRIRRKHLPQKAPKAQPVRSHDGPELANLVA